jgi:hypothetical protein
MKNLHLLTILFLSILTISCSKDESNADTSAQEEAFQATINGGAYSDYPFIMGAYQVTKNSNTLSIDVVDTNGEMVTLFLNGNGGFGSDTVKTMGNIDSSNFVTYGLIRQSQPQISYYSSSGNVTITNNREHPSVSGHGLISGTFTIVATSLDNSNTTTMTGSFIELDYAN